MNRTVNFYKRNLKEVFRDPVIYVFCIAFPVVMFLLFNLINNLSNGNTPTFEIEALLPGIMVFSYSFIMLTIALCVSKDKQTSFLKRLFSSPMKPLEYVLGYAIVGFIIGLLQTVVCIITAFIISLAKKVDFISFDKILLLIVSEIPILVLNVFLGILFGTILNDKSSPAVCSVSISVSGILGGCWMPLEIMGGFETFCRVLPFYPSVYIGRIITGAKNAFLATYAFDSVAVIGLITILAYTLLSVTLAIFAFKKNMVSDN